MLLDVMLLRLREICTRLLEQFLRGEGLIEDVPDIFIPNKKKVSFRLFRETESYVSSFQTHLTSCAGTKPLARHVEKFFFPKIAISPQF